MGKQNNKGLCCPEVRATQGSIMRGFPLRPFNIYSTPEQKQITPRTMPGRHYARNWPMIYKTAHFLRSSVFLCSQLILLSTTVSRSICFDFHVCTAFPIRAFSALSVFGINSVWTEGNMRKWRCLMGESERVGYIITMQLSNLGLIEGEWEKEWEESVTSKKGWNTRKLEGEKGKRSRKKRRERWELFLGQELLNPCQQNDYRQKITDEK